MARAKRKLAHGTIMVILFTFCMSVLLFCTSTRICALRMALGIEDLLTVWEQLGERKENRVYIDLQRQSQLPHSAARYIIPCQQYIPRKFLGFLGWLCSKITFEQGGKKIVAIKSMCHVISS